MDVFFTQIARKIPGIRGKLIQAGIMDSADEYVKKTFFIALMMAVGFAVVVFVFFLKVWVFFLVIIITAPLFFMYFLKYVDVKIDNLRKRIDEEVVFAGRFLIIELGSGVPIHKAFENIHKNYAIVGMYFGEIVSKIYLGTSMEDAINEVLAITPSATLQRILWQMLNSLRTGSDVGPSLNIAVDEIVREQQVAVREYGKKLNPLAMFYMMISVIIPSLGTVMLVVMATFLGMQLNVTVLLGIAGMIGFVQLMFLSIIRTSRPPISM